MFANISFNVLDFFDIRETGIRYQSCELEIKVKYVEKYR